MLCPAGSASFYNTIIINIISFVNRNSQKPLCKKPIFLKSKSPKIRLVMSPLIHINSHFHQSTSSNRPHIRGISKEKNIGLSQKRHFAVALSPPRTVPPNREAHHMPHKYAALPKSLPRKTNVFFKENNKVIKISKIIHKQYTFSQYNNYNSYYA